MQTPGISGTDEACQEQNYLHQEYEQFHKNVFSHIKSICG